MISDKALQDAEGVLLVSLIVGYALAYAVVSLRRRRPDFHIGLPIGVGVAIRVFAVVAINSTGLQTQLRGFDESTFLDLARTVAGTPWGRGFFPHGPYQLHTEVFAVQIKLADLSNTALRVTQIGIAMLGIVFIVAAVYELAGARGARLTAWLLAFEPASLFFNSALHKEPLMLLASGLIVFGGTKIWRRLSVYGVLLAGLGGFIAVETRSYAGWFLVSACVLLLLHAAVRQLDRPGRALPVVYAVIALGFLATPTLLTITSHHSLQTLQASQNANTNVAPSSTSSSANGNNLALERVDFSTRGAVLTNLPRRIFDLIFRPFPWQLGDTSQRLGAIGTLVALASCFLLIGYAWRERAHALTLTAPMLYPLFFLTVAYALSAGNAGTSFRYRTHLVVLGVAMLVVLREHWLTTRSTSDSFAERVPEVPQSTSSVPLPV